MRVVFLDTVGLLALWDESDQWHESASYAYELLTRSPDTITDFQLRTP